MEYLMKLIWCERGRFNPVFLALDPQMYPQRSNMYMLFLCYEFGV